MLPIELFTSHRFGGHLFSHISLFMKPLIAFHFKDRWCTTTMELKNTGSKRD